MKAMRYNPKNLLTSLVLVFPLFLIYQIGVLFTLPVLNGADFLTVFLFRNVGLSASAYLAYTFGWIIGEIVRRTDPKRRPFGRFVQEEVCAPLGIDNLWIGIPDAVEPRVVLILVP